MPSVVLDFQKLKNINSGLGQFCLNLGKNMAKLNEGRFELFFIVPPGMENIFGEGVNYLNPKQFSKQNLKFDLLHLPHQDSLFDCRAQKRIMTIHDLNYLYKYTGLRSWLKTMWLKRRAINADALTFISAFTKTAFSNQFPDLRKTYKIIYNGLCPPVKPHKPEGRESQRPFFFSLGIVSAKKNIHSLIPVMEHFPEYDLIIAGNCSSPYAQKLMREVKQEKLDQQIIFTGEISEQEKSWYLFNCKSLLFPSLSEGFGLPLIEAFHYGKPVFCSRLTSLPEIGGNIAFYWDSFEPRSMANTIRQSLGTWNENLAMAAKERSKLFSWEIAANQYFDFYAEVLSMDHGNNPEEIPR